MICPFNTYRSKGVLRLHPDTLSRLAFWIRMMSQTAFASLEMVLCTRSLFIVAVAVVLVPLPVVLTILRAPSAVACHPLLFLEPPLFLHRFILHFLLRFFRFPLYDGQSCITLITSLMAPVASAASSTMSSGPPTLAPCETPPKSLARMGLR